MSAPYCKSHYFRLGIRLKCLMKVLIRVSATDRAWWCKHEDTLLRELAAGIDANREKLFSISESNSAARKHELNAWVTLERLSYFSKLQDRSSSNTVAKHLTLGQTSVQPEILLPYELEIQVRPVKVSEDKT